MSPPRITVMRGCSYLFTFQYWSSRLTWSGTPSSQYKQKSLFKNNSSRKGAGLLDMIPFCTFSMWFECEICFTPWSKSWISWVFLWSKRAFSRVNMQLQQLKKRLKPWFVGKRKACISAFFSKYRLLWSGRGRRTWTLGTRFWSRARRFSGRVSTFQLVSEHISLSGDKWLCLAKCNNRSSANAYINVFDW